MSKIAEKLDNDAARVQNQEEGCLHRGLKYRHIQMIAIGGSVGVGIFLASAEMIKRAGPAILLVYGLVGLFVYIIMRSLCELAVFKPVSGSFSAYANDYIGSYMGYLTGWSYWLLWCFGVMVETIAIGKYMSYWFDNVPNWIWTLGALVLITLINLISVKLFGELEFWFSIIKVITILALIAVGFGIIVYSYFFGGFSGAGFHNLWAHGGFFPKGYGSIFMAIGPVAVAFVGIESIGLTAGETENPSVNLPKAIDSVIFRVLLFYVGSLLIVMSIFPWNKMSSDVSPFVLTFNKIGLKSAAGLINFVVLTAAFSAGNSGLFSSSRMILTLAQQKNAPKFLSKLSAKQIPILAVIFSSILMFSGVIINLIYPEGAFKMVFSACGMAGFFIWAVILITQLRFRKKLGSAEVSKLKYRSFFFPITNYVGLGFIGLSVFTGFVEGSFRLPLYLFLIWLAILSFIFSIKSYVQKSNK